MRNLDATIEDASEHFVYVPRKCTVNAQDVAFFLSSRLVAAAGEEEAAGGGPAEGGDGGDADAERCGGEEPATRLRRYEGAAAKLAAEFEDGMVRF